MNDYKKIEDYLGLKISNENIPNILSLIKKAQINLCCFKTAMYIYQKLDNKLTNEYFSVCMCLMVSLKYHTDAGVYNCKFAEFLQIPLEDVNFYERKILLQLNYKFNEIELKECNKYKKFIKKIFCFS